MLWSSQSLGGGSYEALPWLGGGGAKPGRGQATRGPTLGKAQQSTATSKWERHISPSTNEDETQKRAGLEVSS